MSRTISTCIGLVLLAAFVLMFGLTGCGEKIITQIETDTLIKIDTVYRPEGPAYVRFISMLPDRNDATIILRRGSSSSSAIFADAIDQMRSEFIPVPALSGFPLYTFCRLNMISHVDSFNFAPFNPTMMYTCALFRQDEGGGSYRVQPRYSLDTMRLKVPKEGVAYLRLIHGLVDYPNPQNWVNLKLKSADSSTIFSNDAKFSDIANYVEVPTGTYPVIVVSPDQPNSALYEQQNVFAEGGYYSALLVGERSKGTDKLIIYTEN